MANPADESKDEVRKLGFDRRVMLRFRGSVVTSDNRALQHRRQGVAAPCGALSAGRD
jgi:hypothetical protein